MKSKSPWITALCASLVLLCAAPVHAVTFDVYPITALLPGFIERQDDIGNSFLTSAILRTGDLVNLALGNSLGTFVPRNVILAAAVGDNNTGRLIVFDTEVKRVVKTIGTVANRQRAENNRGTFASFKRVGTGVVTFARVGAITSGQVSYAGVILASKTADGPSLRTGRPNAVGSFSFTNNGVASNLLVIQGKLTIGGTALASFTE